MPPIIRPQPPHKPNHPNPLLRLQINDLSSPGAQRFLNNIPAGSILQSAVTHVLSLLYPTSTSWLPTRSVTLILESLHGVAYTTGMSLDNDHKEIHLSTDYIASIAPERIADEITGVVVHEMVHCWQHNGRGTCPGGLIEGIADWVRLRAEYAPPHWKQVAEGEWDQGYQVTGYFLQWLEEKRGKGSVSKINEALRETEYQEEDFWTDLFGKKVGALWEEYAEYLRKKESRGTEQEQPIVENTIDEVAELNIAGDGAGA